MCTFQFDGFDGAHSKAASVTGSYDNNGALTATGAYLRIASVTSGCDLFVIKAGDAATLSGTFNVTGTPVPVLITV